MTSPKNNCVCELEQYSMRIEQEKFKTNGIILSALISDHVHLNNRYFF